MARPSNGEGVEGPPPDDAHEEVDEDQDASFDAQLNTASKPKRKAKPKSKKAKKAGTGFEEYYVDAPITPADFEHEQGLYHPSIPFAQRIETAIQRYVAKRNMDSERKNIFDKYLRYGGIDSGPKMFTGGLDPQTIAESNAEEIRTLTATNFVPFDAMDPRNEKYNVDFVACLQSFFSCSFSEDFDLGGDLELKRPALISRAVGVVRNFLNYIIYHSVCAEYFDQIEASKCLCDQAERELWSIEQVKAVLPGTFNRACSQLFGGIFDASERNWEVEDLERLGIEDTRELTLEMARKVFKAGISTHAAPEVLRRYEVQAIGRTIPPPKVEDISLEVIEIIQPSAEARALCALNHGEGLKPLGVLKAQKWLNPYVPAEDLTEEEEAAIALRSASTETYTFWLEEEVLQHCFIGLKMDVTIRELSFGVMYFDAVRGVYCSFYHMSPNFMMDNWREIEKEWLPRRASGGGPLQDEEESVDEH